jgi:hypothetical protein
MAVGHHKLAIVEGRSPDDGNITDSGAVVHIDPHADFDRAPGRHHATMTRSYL